jgi:hypothetical protein
MHATLERHLAEDIEPLLTLQARKVLLSLEKMTIGELAGGDAYPKERDPHGPRSRPMSTEPLNTAEAGSGRVCSTCGTTKANHWRTVKVSNCFKCNGCFLKARFEMGRVEGRTIRRTSSRGPWVSYDSLSRFKRNHQHMGAQRQSSVLIIFNYVYM